MNSLYVALGVAGLLFFLYLKVKDLFLNNRINSNEAKVTQDDKDIADAAARIKEDEVTLDEVLSKYRSDK